MGEVHLRRLFWLIMTFGIISICLAVQKGIRMENLRVGKLLLGAFRALPNGLQAAFAGINLLWRPVPGAVASDPVLDI